MASGFSFMYIIRRVVGTTIEYRTHNGRLHREDGPALIYPDGGEVWFYNGSLHRENGPAAIHPAGSLSWYKEGSRHREDGPAVISGSGNHEEFWLDGIVYTKEEYGEKNTKWKAEG